ncbi:MAG: PspC domain-containing protein [Acidimicrobiaceae bacterium]|nr:PspC domain-containing protein [Acidimicrobiaceae bacterium]
MAGGVASAAAERLRLDPGVVRLLLVVSVLASGIGVAAYMLAWLLIPLEGSDRSIASRATSDLRGIAILIAFSPVLIVTLIASSALGNHFITTLDTALLLSAAGLFLIYRNADPDEREWLRQIGESYLHLTPSASRSKKALAVRILAGVALWAAGMVVLTVGHITAAALRPLLGAALLVVALALLFGPWWLRLGRDLMTERQARIRAEERADMAARVHDSVLQTLALIQRNAEDPQRVAQLARVQERELRSWLFEGRNPGTPGAADPTTVAAGAQQIAREVEAAHGVAVEVVTVGDCELDDELRALLAAGREATVNAAKWSKAPVVSLFAEVEPASVSMFVRDRGVGFDPAAVAADRRGVAESIRGRMSRHGGTATIRSAPGQGTEVELRVPRPVGRP